jgi:Phage P22-like portal protein
LIWSRAGETRFSLLDAFDQEITLGAIPNPDSVLYSPDTKQPDWSDAEWCFVVEPLSIEEFRRQWPNAQKRDFSAEDIRVAKDWISDKTVLVAEYWKVVTTERELKRGKKSRKVSSSTSRTVSRFWTRSSTRA